MAGWPLNDAGHGLPLAADGRGPREHGPSPEPPGRAGPSNPTAVEPHDRPTGPMTVAAPERPTVARSAHGRTPGARPGDRRTWRQLARPAGRRAEVSAVRALGRGGAS